MKKIVVFVALIAVTLSLAAQNDDSEGQNNDDIRTLVGSSNSIGGYGALGMQYARIDDRDAFVFNARGALVLGHMVSLGFSGSGFFNDVHYESSIATDVSLAGGYGGFFFEPILMPTLPVHVAFPVTIGAGGVALVSVNDDNFWEDNYQSEASDAFLVIEPGIEVELNVTQFFRFCVGGYYRYTSDINISHPLEYQIPENVLRGFSAGVTFKFGRF